MTTGETAAVATEWRLFADIDHEILHQQVRRRLTPELVEQHRQRPLAQSYTGDTIIAAAGGSPAG